MNRREFLKRSAIISATGLIIPSVLLEACRKTTLNESDFNGRVIVIGAGVAGLYAAHLLKARGINVQILEASGRYGGRMGKHSGFVNYDIDLGAQWLHGKNNILGELATKSNTELSPDDSDLTYWFNNQITATLPQNIEIFEGEDLPDISFRDFAHDKGLGADYDWIVEALAGDFGADASRISVYNTNKEEENWSSGDSDYKFKQTFFDLIDQQIAAYVRNEIRLNTIVQSIEYAGSTVFISDTNNNTYEADKVIITVPITILKAGTITFNPPLPAEKTTAFSKIGMDAGMKVFLRFSNKFYADFVVGGTVCAAYADDTVGKTTSDYVMLAFIMGEQAENLTALGSDSAIINALLLELDTMYAGQATASFIDGFVQNWTTDPFIRGAYSYSTVGMGDARRVAAEPVDNKLFFAGEAMNLNGHHQTAHGAAESGYREVINILKSAVQ
jgi:monoamine oxidase